MPAKSTKEELLENWNSQAQEIGLNLRTHESLRKIEKNGVFTVHTDKEKNKAKKAVIAIGKFGNPRRLNVPGENKRKVSNFDNPPLFFVIWGIFLAFVALPIFVRYHGKRYCTWICSCGGLAETFGDRWRHLAPKGVRARRWEIMNWPILIASVGITLLIVLAVKIF